jgi:type II secretory ATPase GspE/PulE/Tfp pilus assembly ATPase PilB-like protein
MGVAAYKVASALVGAVAQRLVRTVCPSCRTSYYPPADVLSAIRYQGDLRRPFTRGQGCLDCHDTGFRGRTGIYEVLSATPDLRELLMRDHSIDAIRRWRRGQGGRTLFDEGLRLAEKGTTALDEVLRVAFYEAES